MRSASYDHRHTKEGRGDLIPSPLGTPHPWVCGGLYAKPPLKMEALPLLFCANGVKEDAAIRVEDFLCVQKHTILPAAKTETSHLPSAISYGEFAELRYAIPYRTFISAYCYRPEFVCAIRTRFTPKTKAFLLC